jgi:VCBS repeat protein/hemolysin type calcium-binding protein
MFSVFLLVAALGGAPASASVSFDRTDVTVPGAPDSVALGDLDGRNGLDIAIALPALGSIGVMLNNGDGTFAAIQQHTAGPNCMGTAVDITLGDVTQPTGDSLLPDGNLDAYVACTPYVVRLTGDGKGALADPDSFNLGVQQYLGSDTLDMLALIRRPDGNPVPLLLFQHAAGSFGRQLCVSYELDPSQLSCSPTPVQGPLATGNLNGTEEGVPPDEIITSEGGEKMGVFGFAKVPQLVWADSFRTVPGGTESATLGDLDNDGDLDVLAGTSVNSLNDRVESIHSFEWGETGLEQVAQPLPSVAGLDALAIADVDGDGRNDVVGAGDYGRGVIHLGTGAGNFDGGEDLPQLGYQNPATATRVTLAVGDLTGDGRPDLVVADALFHAVMVFRNGSVCSGAGCPGAPATPPVVANPGPPPSSPAPSPLPRSCEDPGTVPFRVGTAGDDVLVGSAARDVLSGRAGDDCVFGLASDDRLSGGSGSDTLRGSSGSDRLNGDAGGDRVDGGTGNDDISPGAGKDRVAAGGGNDTISARDGARDTIDCGAGRDKVTADRVDAVKNCERVHRATRRRA